MAKYDDKIKDHSWGESLGISKALVFIANELAELNKNLRKIQSKESKR